MTKRYFLEVITSGLLIGMAGDILYLYFAEAWIEPNNAILWTELILLFGAIVLGFLRILFTKL